MTAPPLRVLLAPDKFKGSVSATEVADALAAGLTAAGGVRVPAVHRLPIADGGDGTLDAMLRAGFTPVPVPDGRIARRGTTAVVELAQLCGLARRAEARDPLGASTRAVGTAVLAALDAGCTDIVVGVGGSASTDGGTGFARALGVRFLDAAGAPVAEGGGGLTSVAGIDAAGLDPRLSTLRSLTVATDVTNPLYGDDGAAHVFAPQKGATGDEVRQLDAGLRRLAGVLRDATGTDVAPLPGAGAAGGFAACAVALFGARIVSGADLVLDLLRFDDALAGADVVVTGEGSFDAQTLRGKGPMTVVRRAAAAGAPVVVVAGRIDVAPGVLTAEGIVAAHALTDLEPDVDACMRDAGPLLRRLARTALSSALERITA